MDPLNAALIIVGLIALVLSIRRELNRTACKFCGSTDICPDCRRCYDPSCNAGCVYCRDRVQWGPWSKAGRPVSR